MNAESLKRDKMKPSNRSRLHLNPKIITLTARAILCLLCSFLEAATWAADEWHPLFNGKDLTGWKASENQGGFKVVDGAIAFDGQRSHLFYVGEVKGAEFKNFEFKADVLTRPMANAGIYFHTEFQEKDLPKTGFEAQVANSHLGGGGYVEMKKTGRGPVQGQEKQIKANP